MRQKIAQKRAQIIQEIRNFFNKQKFTEVETPIMVPIPGMEPYLTPFETTLHLGDNKTHKLYLNTSPEIQMKKLLGEGFENIFNINKVFRDGEIYGPMHNPEFTMLEWYRCNADYKDLMKDCENLITTLVKNLSPKNQITYDNHKIDLSLPWLRKTTNELFIEYCDIDLNEKKTYESLKKAALKKGFDTNGCDTWDDIYFKIFLNHIEPKIPPGRPLFVYDYPASQAALAKLNPQNIFFAQRVELYIAGIELANGFSELTNSEEQRQRLTEEQELRKKLGKTVFEIDEEFLASLESIRKNCSGIALGIDRLIMILLNKPTIEEVLLFPMTRLLKNNL